MTDYHKWCVSVSYGSRWIVESVFSVIKRMFGEEVRSKKEKEHDFRVDAQDIIVQQVCNGIIWQGLPTGRYGIVWICATEQEFCRV